MEAAPTLTFEPLEEGVFDRVCAVCIGTGRFLRAVLVPTLAEIGAEVVLAQTRGVSFGKYMEGRPDRTYEVETVLPDGEVLVCKYAVAAAGSLGTAEGRSAFMRLPALLPKLRFVGVGLTEAGIVHNGTAISDLAEFLHSCYRAGVGRKHPISVLNTDNVPFNGDEVRKCVLSCDFTDQVPDSELFRQWLGQSMRFHNSMVDRITSFRPGDPDVPRAEPLPVKALVVEDITEALPHELGSVPGFVLRTKSGQLETDTQLKLRIANGLHTAMVYAMALGRLYRTDACVGHPLVLPYLEQLFERDIVHSSLELGLSRSQLTAVFSEWMGRLQHKHFGLSCFFVCQNAIQKIGLRLMPSVNASLAAGEQPSDFMAFALAVILRFLTPVGEQTRLGEHPPVFAGRLDASEAEDAADTASFEYTPGLCVHPQEGAYDFKDGDGVVPMILRPLGRRGAARNPTAAASLAGEVLARVPGFDARGRPEHAKLVAAVGRMLHQLLDGKAALQLLEELQPCRPLLLTLPRQVGEAVQQEVDAAEAIDIHTHLFPTGYGSLMEYGIDAMLTYHWLEAQYLSTSTELPEDFKELSREERAERIWEGLFVKASPISEQCRGVLTTLSALGLQDEVAARDLQAIRRWYAGQGADMFNEKMMRLARLRYVVISHDPFDPKQVELCLSPPPNPPRYRGALALDRLLEGEWEAVCEALALASEPATLGGLISLLSRCVDAVKPLLITGSTDVNFRYERAAGAGQRLSLQQPIHGELSPQAVLDAVVMPLCMAKNLPLSLRMGARRGVVPELGLAGDALGSAQVGCLAELCCAYPQVRLLATVLSRSDQHEVAVLASKFRNLHLWGCWWYSNNPTIVNDVLAMRFEILGTGFTFQTSSARVHDQLIYKWIHARAQLAKVLTRKYTELLATGWSLSRGDVRRDVQRLLGGAFEEFMAKCL